MKNWSDQYDGAVSKYTSAGRVKVKFSTFQSNAQSSRFDFVDRSASHFDGAFPIYLYLKIALRFGCHLKNSACVFCDCDLSVTKLCMYLLLEVV